MSRISKKYRFSRDDARRFYDRFGSKQDSQGFYENAALDALIRNGRFSDAGSVLEVGCGTGKFAYGLLSERLPATAHYVGIDLSETMVSLAKERLAPWAGRADVLASDGGFDFSTLGASFDRVIFTYVFDLLSEDDIAKALSGAHAVTQMGGFLCAAGLTQGHGILSKMASTIWAGVHGLKPSVVGGCRPIILSNFLDPSKWRLIHKEVVVSATVPSEVIIAEVI